jgi:predicted transcriptional regulator
MPKRNRIDIIEDILFLLSQNKYMKPTHLMYKANLSNQQMKGYLEELVKKKFIDRSLNKKNNYYLTITPQGKKFLGKIKEMKEFEKTFGLEN